MNFNDITLLNTDFEEAVKDAKKGDFIYFDPPYDSETSTFNSYTENGFGKEEQVRLAKVYKELADKGCYVMLSNHNTTLVKELYKDFNIYKADDINIAINDYINYFNTERLAYSLGYKNPIQYRTEQGFK